MLSEQKRQLALRSSSWLWLGPFVYMVAISSYFLIRYQGHWAENDSAIFTKVIRVFSQAGQVVPPRGSGEVYPNGYAFQTISTFILDLTGLDVTALQQITYPFLAALVVLPAWSLFRELTGSVRGATIASLLLFTQPEFLFVILRSSHEKFTRTLLLVCLYLLARSFKLRDQPRLFAAHVLLFYLATYAFIASNNLLAHSFIFAVMLALGLGWILKRRVQRQQHTIPLLQRLGYASIVCLGLVYLFTFYLYPPAQHDLVVLRTIWERMVALFLDVQQESTNAYTQVSSGWINLQVYFMVSSANWLILVSSAMIWLYQGWVWVVRRTSAPGQTAWLLWLLYSAFALQGALSVLADASGSIGNLQHRLFPSFSIMAVAVVGAALADWQPQRFRWAFKFLIPGAIGLMALFSMLKATNEPALSNKWTFYRENELMAVDWADSNLHDAELWTEFDERLQVAFITSRGVSANRNDLRANNLRPTTRSILMTEVTRLRGLRLGRPLPVPADALIVYDNGGAQIYRLRPQSQFQQ